MSIKAMQTVLDESRQKGSTLLLLLILANYAHDDGTYAFPSIDTMAKYTRLQKRNIYILLNRLKASGELAEMGIHNSGTIIYRIALPGLTGGGAKFTSAKSTGMQPRSQRGDRDDREGVIPAAPDPLSNQQEPSEETDAQFVLRMGLSRGYTAHQAWKIGEAHTTSGKLNRATFLSNLPRRR